MATKAAAPKRQTKKKEARKDLGKTYNEFKEFEGHQYTGMKVLQDLITQLEHAPEKVQEEPAEAKTIEPATADPKKEKAGTTQAAKSKAPAKTKISAPTKVAARAKTTPSNGVPKPKSSRKTSKAKQPAMEFA